MVRLRHWLAWLQAGKGRLGCSASVLTVLPQDSALWGHGVHALSALLHSTAPGLSAHTLPSSRLTLGRRLEGTPLQPELCLVLPWARASSRDGQELQPRESGWSGSGPVPSSSGRIWLEEATLLRASLGWLLAHGGLTRPSCQTQAIPCVLGALVWLGVPREHSGTDHLSAGV